MSRRSDWRTALLIAVLVAGVTPAAASIYGSWELMRTERAGVSYEIVMTIEEQRVRMTSRCSHGEKTVEVEVSSTAEITGDELRITGSDRQEREYSPGYLRCSAAIRPATLRYELDEGKLVLNDPSKTEPVVLSRAGS